VGNNERMTPTTLVTELAAALLVGVLIGCVGVGGVLLPPALVYLGGLGFHAAAATSTWAFLFCGAAGIESQAAGGPGDSRRGPEAELTPLDTPLERFSEHLFADENERCTSETKAARESVEAVLDACFLVRRMTPKTPPPKPIPI
jgi:Sulfite exporter TauE/SafE